MNKEQLSEIARSAFETAKGIIEGGADAAPMFLLADPAAVIPVAFSSSAEKDYVFGRMREILQVTGASAYVFVTEAWMLKLDKGQAYDGRLPSESPERIDSLQVDAWTRNGDHVLMCAEIKATDDRRRVTEPQIETSTVTVGRAANLFESVVYHSIQ